MAVLGLVILLAFPLLAPSISAARPSGSAEDRVRIEMDIEAALETPSLSVSAQVSGEVEAFGVRWDVTPLSFPAFFELRAVATSSGRSDACSAQLPGVVTASASAETSPERLYPASGQIVIDVAAAPAVAHCTLIDMDIVLSFDQRVVRSFGTDPATGDAVVDSRSSSAVSLQAIDVRTGTSLGGRVSVFGIQVGTVVEPAEPDKLGRVKVQFHWDTQQTSNWVRMAQPYAGGSLIIPRIGWEVVVEGVSLQGSSERRDEFRVAPSESALDRFEVEFRSQATDAFEVLAEDLVELGNFVGADGRWAGEVPEGDASLPGLAVFDAALRLTDRRPAPLFTPIVDHQRLRVGSLALVHGEDLRGTNPSIRFGSSVQAPAPSPVGLTVRQGTRLDATDAIWPAFTIRFTSYVAVEAFATGSAEIPTVRFEGTVETEIRGDARLGRAEVERRHRFFMIVDRSGFPPASVDVSGAAIVPIPLAPAQGGPPRARGEYELLQRISLPITTRSNVFAVWSTVGFFEVSSDGYRAVERGSLGVSGAFETEFLSEPVSIDLRFPVSIDGRRYKPLFAFVVIDLDNRVNLNLQGNRIESSGGIQRPVLFGPGGLLEPRPFFDVFLTTPTDRFAVPSTSQAVASLQGDVFSLDFTGMTLA